VIVIKRLPKFHRLVCFFSRPFLLYIGIFDIHRCAYGNKLGDFCENFGDGTTPGTGSIEDWKPIVYEPEDVEVPYFLPDTPATRQDLANMYKTYSRFDQGIRIGMINDIFRCTHNKVIQS